MICPKDYSRGWRRLTLYPKTSYCSWHRATVMQEGSESESWGSLSPLNSLMRSSQGHGLQPRCRWPRRAGSAVALFASRSVGFLLASWKLAESSAGIATLLWVTRPITLPPWVMRHQEPPGTFSSSVLGHHLPNLPLVLPGCFSWEARMDVEAGP